MLSTISPLSILLILLLVLVLFGTKKLRNIGSDLGSAIKGFRKAMKQDGDSDADNSEKIIENQPQQADDEK